MHKKIVNFVKYNKVFLGIYRFFGNAFVAILSLFVRINKKRILFMSFGGQKYDDSPKELFLKIKNDPAFVDYEFIWGFTQPSNFETGCKKVKVDTIRFYIVALSSKIWINNSSVERGLKLKRSKTIEINTWHGTPLKKMGKDIPNYKGYKSKAKKCKGITIYCAQSEYDRDIFARLFNTVKDNIILSDLPRNDVLLQYSEKQIEEVKTSLNIPLDKKVILYAPTFREYDRDKLNSCYIKPPITISKWKEQLSNEYVFLLRAHYEVVNVLGVAEDDFVYNVSKYPCLSDLIAISDLMISDYSSIYFDYAITEKPMLNFSYDLNEYKTFRGLYLDIENDLPCKLNMLEEDVIEEIKAMDFEEYIKRSKEFKKRFTPNSGMECEMVINKLKTLI